MHPNVSEKENETHTDIQWIKICGFELVSPAAEILLLFRSTER